MRCKNCGWPNKPNERVCVKCHAPLSPDDDSMERGGGAGREYQREDIALNKTVCEEDIFGQAVAAEPYHADRRQPEEPEEKTRPCPKCGYPVRVGTDKCPNCKFSVSQSGEPVRRQPTAMVDEQPQPKEEHRRPTRMNQEEARQTGFRGTINPYMMGMNMEPTFVLKPIKRMNERNEPEEMEYEGKEIFLNRANTEPNNPSITSRQQAVVTRIDGNWYIEDKSDMKTTFVQASRRIELHDGDIILLGNRLFEFHE